MRLMYWFVMGTVPETKPTIPSEKGKLDTRLHTWTLIESVGSIKIKNRSWSFSCPNAIIPHGFCHIPSKFNDLVSHLLQGGINCFCSQEGRHCICFPWCLKLRCRDQLTTLQIHIALRKKKLEISSENQAVPCKILRVDTNSISPLFDYLNWVLTASQDR